MKRLTLTLFAAIGLSALWAGPKVTVIGDSYSTWGPLQPAAYAVAYNGVYNGVTSSDQQYWSIFIRHVNGELCVLNAWSGSFLAARSVHQSFVDQRRLNNLGDADIVVICGGTNDAWGSDGGNRVAIGEEKYGEWSDDDLKTFFPALTYLVCEVRKRLPHADIVIVANSCDDYVDSGNTHRDVGIAPAYCAAMKTVAEHYGLCFVQCSGVEKNDYHPTVAGFATMGAQLNAAWDDYVVRKQSGAHAFRFVSRDPASASGSVADFDAAKVEESFTSGGIVYRFLDTTAPIGFTLKRDAQLEWALVVGGGGAGGGNCGGGGGGGGLLDLDWRAAPKALAAGTTLTVSVGAGGVGNSVATAPGENGCDSSLTGVDGGFTAFGGGGGGSYNSKPGSPGGSGGGGVCLANNGAGGGGGSTTDGAYGHGCAGGGGVWSGGMPFCGGGGGAGGEGKTGADPKAGDGGDGYSCAITGAPVLYAGGGGAGAVKSNGRTRGSGGSGGGDGAFPNTGSGYGENGTDGLGGGGGGAGGNATPVCGGSGGSGVVILRFVGSFAPVLEASAMVSATNSPFAMTVDCTLVAAGEGASEAEVFIAYGEETVGERIRLGTLSAGESGRYEITGLSPETDYLCNLILVSNAETPSTVVLESTIRTLPVAEELKPVVTLTRTDLQMTSAKLSVAVPQIGEGSDDATVTVRLTAGDAVGEWEVLAASVKSGWTTEVSLTDLQTGLPHIYEVKVLNAQGLAASAQVAFTPVEPEPERDLGRTVSVAEQILDDRGQIVRLRLSIGNAGTVFSNTKLYAAYAEVDAGERREDWERCAFVADIPNSVRTYEYVMPEGWGTDYLALRFFTVSDALPPASTAYVRDGLHAQWDAIDNVGVGQHVASSSVWVNLADADHNLAWQGGTASFGEKGVDTGASYFAATTEASWWTAMGKDYTWEAYVTIPSSSGGDSTLMGSGNGASLHALFCQDNGIKGWGFYQMYSYAGHGDIGPQADVIPHDGATSVHLAYVVTPEGAKLYVDGTLAGAKSETMHAFNETTAYASAGQFWVGAGYAAGRKMQATVHAVRLYASSLTEEQLQANLTTDRERYGNAVSTVVGVSPLVERDAPRLEVRVTPYTPTSAWFDYTLVGTGFGATKADVFLSVGVGTVGARKKIGTLARGQSGRHLVEGLASDTTCVYRIETENDATPSESWSKNGEFTLHFDPVEPSGDLRSIALVPGARSVTLNFGAAEYEGTMPLYACYGAVVSTDGTNGWDHVVKVADVAASTASLVWNYPSGWGRSSAAVRFVFDGQKGYDVHEYIDSTGTQYVYTGLEPKMSMSYAGKAQSLNQNVRTGDKWVTLYGCYVNGDQCLFWYGNDFYFNNPGNYKVAGIGTSVCEFSTTDYDVSRSPRTSVTANGTTAVGNNNWSATLTAKSMPLFAFDRKGVLMTCNSDIRLYWFKAFDGGTLVRDFVPIVKDGVPMLYDRANGDPAHGPLYPRDDGGDIEFRVSEGVTGEKVYLRGFSASEVLYHNASMKGRGLIVVFGTRQ